MSDDEADLDLLALLRQHLGLGPPDPSLPPDTRVLKDAQYICDNSVDVAIDMQGTRYAAERIWNCMQKREYSTESWYSNGLHPTGKDEAALDFIFTMDLLNFSFWSSENTESRFSVEYNGERWTGYWSLIAALRRALDEGVPITSPAYWHSEDCTDEILRNVFRSSTSEEMPLLEERIRILREAAEVLCKEFDLSIAKIISDSNGSAARLVNLLTDKFPCFRDETKFEGKTVRFFKRAQIFAADLWAAFDGNGLGQFNDIDQITMFADYRIPQQLRRYGALSYSPPLEDHIKKLELIPTGHNWEVQIRGCSVWCIEQIRKEIKRIAPTSSINAVLIDFFLYDLSKEIEAKGEELTPHHRTRSIWY